MTAAPPLPHCRGTVGSLSKRLQATRRMEKNIFSWAQRGSRSLLGHLLHCFPFSSSDGVHLFHQFSFIPPRPSLSLQLSVSVQEPLNPGKAASQNQAAGQGSLIRSTREGCAHVKGSEAPQKEYSLSCPFVINGPAWAEQSGLLSCTPRYVGLRSAAPPSLSLEMVTESRFSGFL